MSRWDHPILWICFTPDTNCGIICSISSPRKLNKRENKIFAKSYFSKSSYFCNFSRWNEKNIPKTFSEKTQNCKIMFFKISTFLQFQPMEWKITKFIKKHFLKKSKWRHHHHHQWSCRRASDHRARCRALQNTTRWETKTKQSKMKITRGWKIPCRRCRSGHLHDRCANLQIQWIKHQKKILNTKKHFSKRTESFTHVGWWRW